jgi:hypothetical protein
VTSIDLHPEDLFDRSRRGEASERDIERFQTHLEQCRACRFEYTLALECAEGSAVLPGDELVINRIRQATARSLERCAGSGALIERARDRTKSRLLFFAAAFLFSLVGFTFIATILTPASRLPRLSFLGRSVAASMWGEPLAQSFASAGDLFARANVAQRDGAAADAARLYTELERSFPGSAEELVARVLLGRLLLDRLDDARGALAQFDSYLANPDHDALAEEALIGRALALERLNRHTEERSAWEVLLGAHPRSSYAEPARTRLEELR